MAKENLIKTDSVKKYANGGKLSAKGSLFDIKNNNVAISSFRKVDKGYELRVFETDGKEEELRIVDAFNKRQVVDLIGNKLTEGVNKISPYQIKTILYK